jgi:hypothetical protein
MVTPQDLFSKAMLGWQRGAEGKPREPAGGTDDQLREAYENGYKFGVDDRRRRQEDFSSVYGYGPDNFWRQKG